MERTCSRTIFIGCLLSYLHPPPGLQGHAIKNQDLLIASGTVASKGSEGLTAVDEDIQAAVRILCFYHLMHVETPHVPASADPGNGPGT